jgi:apolipoprotein N-acyltransferase
VISWLSGRHPIVRIGLAAASGLITALGFAPYGWWPLTIIGVAGLSSCVLAATRMRGAAGLGYAFGLGFLGLGLNWMQIIFVEAMIGLVAVEAVFFAALGALVKIAGKTPWWPLAAAGAWTITEFTYARFPFGGFGWMRLGYAMVDSPLAWGLPVLGVAGVGFITAALAQLLAWLGERVSLKRTGVVAGGLAAAIGVSALGLLIVPGQSSGQLSVGWVQGGAPGGGVYGLGPARSITTNQVAETNRLMQRIEAGELPRPDFIVWPENSTDMDPFTDYRTGALVQAALNRTQLPILVGSVVADQKADTRQTVSLWWDPTKGVVAEYAKRGIVPFGEWVPLRSLLLPLLPELAYVGADSIPGTQPGVITPTLANGRTVKLGVIICYDLAFDNIVHDTLTNGAQVLVVQSSNAMYQGTGQIDQQFAITRARAMESRREVLVVTTSGISGLINPDGSVAFQTTDHQSASGVVTLPVREGGTPAVVYGTLMELCMVILGLAGLVASVFYGRMAKSETDSGAEHG